jgi:hypothetical protein
MLVLTNMCSHDTLEISNGERAFDSITAGGPGIRVMTGLHDIICLQFEAGSQDAMCILWLI